MRQVRRVKAVTRITDFNGIARVVIVSDPTIQRTNEFVGPDICKSTTSSTIIKLILINGVVSVSPVDSVVFRGANKIHFIILLERQF